MHKLALVAGSFAAPGFAQAVAGRRRVAIVWAAALVAGTALVTLSIWVALGLFALRLAAAVSALFELHRFDGAPRWWRTLSTTVFVAGLASGALARVQVESFRIPSSSMYPTLEIGDYIFADRLSLMWRTPERGEVIVFRYPCDESRFYVKRVIAVGGDTVEVRCSIVYVNGAAIENQLVDANVSYLDLDYQGQTWQPRAASRYRETLGGHTYDVFHDRELPERDRQPGTRANADVHDFPRVDSPFPPSCGQGEFFDEPPGGRSQLTGTLVVTKPGAKTCEPQAHFVVPPGGLFVMGDNRDNANDSRYWGVVSVDAVIGRVIGVWLNSPPHAERQWSRLGAIE